MGEQETGEKRGDKKDKGKEKGIRKREKEKGSCVVGISPPNVCGSVSGPAAVPGGLGNHQKPTKRAKSKGPPLPFWKFLLKR